MTAENAAEVIGIAAERLKDVARRNRILVVMADLRFGSADQVRGRIAIAGS